MKKNYILMVDTETAGTIDAPLVFDFGCAVVDQKGRVYETRSLICYEIFYEHKMEMENCFYQAKLPAYRDEIWDGSRDVRNLLGIKQIVNNLIKKYNIRAVCAHNAAFDIKALNNTMNVVTDGAMHYFFPPQVEIWDTLKMANQICGKMTTYKNWCNENGYMTKHATPRPRMTAEILYRFITVNHEFNEAHTGLCDVLIEKDILAYLISRHKKLDRVLYPARV